MLDRRDLVIRQDNRICLVMGLGRFDDVARACPRDLCERHTDQRDHLPGRGPWRRNVVFIEKRSHHQVEHPLWMIGNVDEDEQVTSDTRTKAGQTSETPQVVDLVPDLDKGFVCEHRLGRCQELPGLPKVEELDLVRHCRDGSSA